MLFGAAIVLTILLLFYVLRIRSSDLPEPTPVSPTHHLEVRKAAIYENLRDLQFEYRLGKLSDADYQSTKLELQTQLAVVLGEIDAINSPAGQQRAPKAKAAAAPRQAETAKVCPHCAARFDKPLKFCGECGKPMTGDAA
jgi:rRNA maturation endonuclease Nob1